MTDTFTRWVPHEALIVPPVIDKIVDGDLGLDLFIALESQAKRRLLIRFESAVAYRNINESYLIRTWKELGVTRWPGSCYICTKSSWLELLKGEACGLLDGVKLIHYCVYTDEDCVEIATEFPPEAMWVPL